MADPHVATTVDWVKGKKMPTTTDIVAGSGTWTAIADDGITVTAPVNAGDPLRISIDYTAKELFESPGHGIIDVEFKEPAGHASNFGLRLPIVVDVTNHLGADWNGFVLYESDNVITDPLDSGSVHPTGYGHFHSVEVNTFPGLVSTVFLQDFSTPAAFGPAGSGAIPAPGQIQAAGLVADGTTITSLPFVIHKIENAGVDDGFHVSFYEVPTSGQQIVALAPSDQTLHGAGTFSFDVLRGGSSDAINTDSTFVHYSVLGSGINGTDPSDFVGGVLPSGTINFAAGDNTETISFDVTGQTASKLDETFIVKLDSPETGTAIGIIGPTGGTIQNVDAVVPAAIDWNALAAEVNAYHDATGQWGLIDSWIDTGQPWPA